MRTVREILSVLGVFFLPIMIFVACSVLEKNDCPEENTVEMYSFCEESLFDENPFYYYLDKKFFLTQRTDRIHLQFASGVDYAQLKTLIAASAVPFEFSGLLFEESLHGVRLEGFLRYAMLAKSENQIPASAVTFFKRSPKVVSVGYMYLKGGPGGIWYGLTNEFVVQLKKDTSYGQLERLAEQNGCIIGDDDLFMENLFVLYVSKTSKLNAMQTANLFYETGLFECSRPNFIEYYWGLH
ncbi:MAG: hypothetical protein FWE99_05920 [Bacteroidales bacterium]|nr:hypothetical protein [Bacteroidales bacterium]